MAAIPRLPRPSTVGALTTIVFLSLVIAAFVPGVILPLTMAQVGFALLHGARRYGWRAIGVFVAAGLVISNVLENLSIKAGFPFGHYHYTGGGKIFQVPWFIGPAYLATGYLAWIVATVLVDDVGRNARWPSVIGTPVIGAFAMAAWDLALDPSSSTIDHHWIWENGGGFFGVPLGNFLGWTFTVYLFMQVFSLYLRRRGPARAAQPDATTRSDLQALLLYAATTVSYIATLFTGKNTIVTDAAGRAWHTADIYESSALLATYGMGFIALLAVLRIIQRRQDEPTPTTTPVPVPVQQPMAYNPTR